METGVTLLMQEKFQRGVAIAVCHGLTANHRLTASDVTATVDGHSKIQFRVHDT